MPETEFKATQGDVGQTLEITYYCEQCGARNELEAVAGLGVGAVRLVGAPCGGCEATYEFTYEPANYPEGAPRKIVNCSVVNPHRLKGRC